MVAVITYDHPISSLAKMSVSKVLVAHLNLVESLLLALLLIP